MNRLKISGALLFGAALSLPGISHAQTTPAKVIEGKTFTMDDVEIIENAQIHVSNVASNLMAYWLDPMHQPMPISIQMSEKNAGVLYRTGIAVAAQPGNGKGPDNLKLPDGIQGLVSVDPQNVLRIRGTKAGIETLQKLVKDMDVPLNEVDIEAQIWEMSPDTFKSLPLVFRSALNSEDAKKNIRPTGDTAGDKADNTPLNADFLWRVALAAPASDIAPTTQILEASLQNKSAHLLTAPRVTVIDGLVATVQLNESRALIFDAAKSAAPQAKPKTKEMASPADDVNKETFPEGLAFVNGQTGLTVGPLLHGDALSLNFNITLDSSVTQAATTLRDGQTLAVRLPYANPATGWPRVALIKAHIINHAGDAVAVPKN